MPQHDARSHRAPHRVARSRAARGRPSPWRCSGSGSRSRSWCPTTRPPGRSGPPRRRCAPAASPGARRPRPRGTRWSRRRVDHGACTRARRPARSSPAVAGDRRSPARRTARRPHSACRDRRPQPPPSRRRGSTRSPRSGRSRCPRSPPRLPSASAHLSTRACRTSDANELPEVARSRITGYRTYRTWGPVDSRTTSRAGRSTGSAVASSVRRLRSRWATAAEPRLTNGEAMLVR